MINIRREQLLNIVAFCALMENNDGIIGKSPDYIIEKFNRYCLREEGEYAWGLDNARQKIVSYWREKWLR